MMDLTTNQLEKTKEKILWEVRDWALRTMNPMTLEHNFRKVLDVLPEQWFRTFSFTMSVMSAIGERYPNGDVKSRIYSLYIQPYMYDRLYSSNEHILGHHNKSSGVGNNERYPRLIITQDQIMVRSGEGTAPVALNPNRLKTDTGELRGILLEYIAECLLLGL